jgi:hypothetical protein
MSHILHLGHQPTDIAGITARLSTDAAGFDPGLDVNGLRFAGSSSHVNPFAFPIPAPQGDLWLGFRYVPPNGDAAFITVASASFLEILDAEQRLLAQVKPLTSTSRYHAIAHGDASVEGASSYAAPNGGAEWVDLRLSVGATITLEFHVNGTLRSSATAANTAGKGKPVLVVFANRGLNGAGFGERIWYYAHVAALDGVSTIGRRFVRRTPNTIASFNQMTGSIEALRDGDIATRVASTAAGQRMSFSLAGPTGPATVSAIAGLHLKQIAQGGTEGPGATAGFLRMGGVNHDAPGITLPMVAPRPVYSTWLANPVDASPWTSLTLPTEVGIVSA